MGRHTLSPPDGPAATHAANAADSDQAAGWPHKASGYAAFRVSPSTLSGPTLALTSAVDIEGLDLGLGSTMGASPAPVGVRPTLSRALSGGIGLLAQPRSASRVQSMPAPTLDVTLSPVGAAPPTVETGAPAQRDGDGACGDGTQDNVPAAREPLTTSLASGCASRAQDPSAQRASVEPSLLFSITEVAPVLLDIPSPAPHIVRTSPPPPSEPQPVCFPSASLLSAPSSGSASPRTPPNLRLEIPPQDGVQIPARDGLRAPFAPDPENEGICTEVGSLGQEIQLESGDHLNALERIYLYTQSKATFHRIFMSRALPTYLKEVTPVEAIEYVLPLLGGLAIDEEERVKETFAAELLGIIWWFFTTCRVTDQEVEPAPPPEPDAPPPEPDAEPPLISVQSFSAVLASLLLSNIPSVSATARGTVVELLGRTRWIVNNPGQTDVQHTQYCEAMRPVGEWDKGLLGVAEARMIQLEIIYSVIIDLGRLDLDAEEMAMAEGAEQLEAVKQEGGHHDSPYDLELNASKEDVTTLDGPSLSHGNNAPLTFPASDFPKPGSISLSDSALTPTPTNSKSYADPMAASTPRSGSAPASVNGRSPGVSVMSGGESSSSLNLPELSPADSNSRSSVASPAEPVSPPERAGADYVEGGQGDTGPSALSVPAQGYKSSAPSSPGTDDLELSWHMANNSESESVDGGFLAVPSRGYESGRPERPRLTRSLSLVSNATSGIDPNDYADAEDWEDEVHLNGVEVNGVETSAEDVGAVEVDETATEVGDPLIGEEVIADDAYIDDGAAAEEAAIGRVASMSLIAAVTSSGVVDEEIYTLFLEEVIRVSADPVYWVRSETSYALGTLAKAVGDGPVEPYLLPILESLMTDTEAHVRQASVFAIPSVLKRLTPQRRREIATKYMLKLCEDDAETVKTGALQVLAEVIHTFREDEGGPPDELLDFFLKGEHNQVHAVLSAPISPPQDNIWAEPSSYFPVEPSFPDPDRALICAFNLPAVALTLGAARWSRLAGYYTYLAEESWHTPKVRSTLGASTGEIARIVGPAAARRDVAPVWWTCVSNGEREAKIKALGALPLLLDSLDAGGRAEIAAKMGEAWEGDILTGWKEREAFAKQLGSAARSLKDQPAVLCRIFKSGLEDRVAAVREAIIAAVPVLHEVLEGDLVHTRIARDDLFALATSGTYRHRTTFLACCRALVESARGAWILDEQRFSGSVASLAAHSVIDVRIGVGRLLTSVCERHMPRRDQRPSWLIECLEKLSLDSSPDVRSYVHRVTYSDLIELRPPADPPRPGLDDRPASPGFAEFSRPP
ncbi:hypothetical protein FRC06_005768 [Ceratobasidium sp. 370]|nr:hypothetical protein FRC06_005768 [Ceratobasidium sp. 370]